MAKKRRTAKQRAATRKMIRARKAQLRKQKKTARRKGTRRKTAKRKTRRNPQKARPGLAKSHLWVIFKCLGKSVHWLTVGIVGGKATPTWTSKKGDAITFSTKKRAGAAARSLAKKRGMSRYHIGATSRAKTATQIANYCATFKELTPGKK